MTNRVLRIQFGMMISFLHGAVLKGVTEARFNYPTLAKTGGWGLQESIFAPSWFFLFHILPTYING